MKEDLTSYFAEACLLRDVCIPCSYQCKPTAGLREISGGGFGGDDCYQEERIFWGQHLCVIYLTSQVFAIGQGGHPGTVSSVCIRTAKIRLPCLMRKSVLACRHRWSLSATISTAASAGWIPYRASNRYAMNIKNMEHTY